MTDDDKTGPRAQSSVDDPFGITRLFIGATSVVEKGGVVALLTVGLVLMVAPTVEIFFNVVHTSTVTHGNYVIAMVVGAVVMGCGGLFGVVSDVARRRGILALERINSKRLNRSIDFQQKLLERFADMNQSDRDAYLAQARRSVELLSESVMLGPEPKK